MEVIPPSYESATSRDAWPLIAEYVWASDLCAASLVCQRWHALFMPLLWGNPAAHFGTENDAVYDALMRFRRTLKHARLEVRMLTHTLHLPPALSEYYGKFGSDWLREILEYLPRLQLLVVSEFSLFDHNAMMALRGSSRTTPNAAEDAYRTYNLRVLLAERATNATSQGLVGALPRLSALIYLDLSFTRSARDLSVLASLSQLGHLQVLKLRGIGLRDIDAEVLARAIGIRARYLDLRDNFLTDTTLRSLLQFSFPLVDPAVVAIPTMSAEEASNAASASVMRANLLSRLDLDEQFLRILNRPLTGRSFVEDLPHVGITHFFISNNQITVKGVANLLASTRIHVLDVGTVHTVKNKGKTPQAVFPQLSGAESWLPLLDKYAKDNLTYIRADHSLVTSNAAVNYSHPTTAVRPQILNGKAQPGCQASGSTGLGGAQDIHTLPAYSETQFESAGISVPPPEVPPYSQISQQGSHLEQIQTLKQRGRSSAFVPEAETANFNQARMNSVDSLKVSEDRIPSFSLVSRSVPELPEGTPQVIETFSTVDSRTQKTADLLSKRPKKHGDNRESSMTSLHPSQLPRLETLVLTGVPSHVTQESHILNSLKRFITDCSNEALLATLQAGSDYSLPPGRARIKAEKERARSLFGLRRLVLEITPTSRAHIASWKTHNYYDGELKSSTGDPDSENLWSAAKEDFSFFDEEEIDSLNNEDVPLSWLDEEVNLTLDDDEPMHSSPSKAEAAGPLESVNQHSTQQIIPQPKLNSATTPLRESGSNRAKAEAMPEVDLVAEIAAFRRQKAAEFEMLRQERSDPGPFDGERTVSSSLLPVSSTLRMLPAPGTASTDSRSLKSSTSPPHMISRSMSWSSTSIVPPHVEGHWEGEIHVIRNAAPS